VKATSPRKSGRALGPEEVAYLALLSVAVVLCFYPLSQYFFAQDDFVLLESSWRNGIGEAISYFQSEPGQFRPLTKGVYFWITYRIFGLNALPYHLISIAFYILNIWLMYILLRRLGIHKYAALVTSTLFGLSVAYFHIIAWISCIQQLVGQTFLLATLIFGIDALDSDRATPRNLSLAAYLGALLSYEQTLTAPLILLLIARLQIVPRRKNRSLGGVIRILGPELGLMIVYLFFVLLWKGTPDTGSYAFAYGKNMIVNVMSYLGWVTSFGANLPTEFNRDTVPFGIGQIAVALIVIYHLARRRIAQVIFGTAFFFLTIGPAIFLVHHTSYLHTYSAALGFAYLIALAAEDVLSGKRIRSERARWAIAAGVFVAMSVVSYTMVRHNEREQMHGSWGFKKSFVLRRAEIAEEAYRSISRAKAGAPAPDAVIMVYGRPGGKDSFNMRNVIAALGDGSAIRLFYDMPYLKIRFTSIDDPVSSEITDRTHLYNFDDGGGCLPMHNRRRNQP
jgi:hypothetical protein